MAGAATSLVAGLLLGVARGAAPCDGGTDSYVGDEAALGDAAGLSSANGVIHLTADIVLTGPVVFDDCVTLDGEGYSIDTEAVIGGIPLQFPEGGNVRKLRLVPASGTQVEVTGDATVESVHICGGLADGGSALFEVSGTATVNHLVAEGVSGTGAILDVGGASVDHVTVVGNIDEVVRGGGGLMTHSVLTTQPGPSWTLDSATSLAAKGGEFLERKDWQCAVDARPVASGALWDAGGDHIGGYTGTAGGAGTTPFVGWADDDGDDFGYGPLGDPAWDCDDAEPAVHPNADELCDSTDNDCDGTVDIDPIAGEDGLLDADDDGYVSEVPCLYCLAVASECLPPTTDPDCDDGNSSIPATEDCPEPKTTDTGTPGDDDDDDTPGDDDDDDVIPGDDDDDDVGTPTDVTVPGDTGGAGLNGSSVDGCQCASADVGRPWWALSRRR